MPSPDPVNAAMIRHWCAALGDRNPAYLDEAFARRTVHGGIIAPPTMLQVWTMPGYNAQPAGPDAIADLYAVFDELGYTSLVATDSEQEYLRPLRLGDSISATKTVMAITAEKTTALGKGHFLATAIDIVDAAGESVARQLHRVLRFRPATPETARAHTAAEKAPEGRLPPDTRPVDTRRPETSSESLPELLIPVDRTSIVATAIATRDFQPVHHDPDAARRGGSPDIFMNILTSQGLVGRYVTDWAGPNATLRKVAIRLGASNYPGDTMAMSGAITARRSVHGGEELDIEVRGTNRRGTHVTGRVTVTVPARVPAPVPE